MTSAEGYSPEKKAVFPHGTFAAFLSLLLCYFTGTAFAYFAAYRGCSPSCWYVARSISRLSLYDVLSSLVFYMRSVIGQTVLIFASAFTFFPTWISGGAALYRGVCTGVFLYLIRAERILVANGRPQIALSLYFLASAALFILAVHARVCSETLGALRKRRDRRNFQLLLFAYIKRFLVISGGIFAVCALAVISS